MQFSYSQILMISIMFDWREDHILVRKYYILLSENTIFNIYDVCRNNARYQKNIEQLIKCTGKRCFFCHNTFLNKLRKFTLILRNISPENHRNSVQPISLFFFWSETFITIYFAIKIQWIPFLQFLMYIHAFLKRWNKRLNIYKWHCMKLWLSMYQN